MENEELVGVSPITIYSYSRGMRRGERHFLLKRERERGTETAAGDGSVLDQVGTDLGF